LSAAVLRNGVQMYFTKSSAAVTTRPTTSDTVGRAESVEVPLEADAQVLRDAAEVLRSDPRGDGAGAGLRQLLPVRRHAAETLVGVGGVPEGSFGGGSAAGGFAVAGGHCHMPGTFILDRLTRRLRRPHTSRSSKGRGDFQDRHASNLPPQRSGQGYADRLCYQRGYVTSFIKLS
jgi:hypothetical protein